MHIWRHKQMPTIKYGIAETFCFPSLWSSLNRTSHSVRATDTESKLISRMLNCRTCFCLTHSFTQLNLIKKKSKSRICKMLMAYSMIEYNAIYIKMAQALVSDTYNKPSTTLLGAHVRHQIQWFMQYFHNYIHTNFFFREYHTN